MLISSLPDDPSRPTSPAAILASSGMAAAMAIRVAAGGKLAPPDPMASHAADLLRLIRGTASPASHVRAFEIYLVAMMEHSLNASTFAARVVASTGAGMVAAVTASLAALRGPLHGGALALVLDMLDEARSSPDAGVYVSRRLAIGPRLFGFGSRGYTGRDPRADIFKRALLEFEGDRSRVAYAEEFESAALECLRQKKSGRRIETNVEFYAALLLEAIGIPRSGFTAVFAASRCAGWIGHIREEERDGRLMRPAARYVGTMPA
jgi:citrate synthase